eukprot:s97_g13.t1
MGVRDLLKVLKKERALEEPPANQAPTSLEDVLMVDFQAFCFWLLASFEDEISSWDFAKVSSLAASFVRRFERCGVLCKFVDDGARGSAGLAEMEGKLPEWKSRAEQQLTTVRDLKLYLDGSGSKPSGPPQRGALFSAAVRRGLESTNGAAVLCTAFGEADPVLAAELLKPRTIGILGNDTDFVLMKHGRFIQLDELKREDFLEGHTKLVLRIRSRERLAEALKVREEVLPMAAALCGNDHSKALMEKCRNRHLPGPEGEPLTEQFVQLAQLLQKGLDAGCSPEEKALELLAPALLSTEDYNYAIQVLTDVQRFYAPRVESKMEIKDNTKTTVYSEVQSGKIPKWCWPLAAHGLYYASRVLEDPGLGSCSSSVLLELKTCALRLLAPNPIGGKVKLRLLGAISETNLFHDTERLMNKEGPLMTYRKWVPRLRKNWILETVEGLVDGCQQPNRVWDEERSLTVRELHLLALRFTRRLAMKLKVTSVEFDAMTSMAWLLLSSDPALAAAQRAPAVKPSFRCVSLGAWYQEVLVAIWDLAKLMHVAPPSCEIHQLFSGRVFLRCLEFWDNASASTRPAGNGAAGASRRWVQKQKAPRNWIDGENDGQGEGEQLQEDLEKMRRSENYRNWSREVNQGLEECRLHKPTSLALGTLPVSAPTEGKGLPIEEHKEKLEAALMTNRVVCVHGETGSGKSTQVPQYILTLFPEAQIAVTQPRRMAAVNLAKRVAKERDEDLGVTVGYRIGGDSVIGRRLNFQTTGWLLRALVSNTNRLGSLTHVVFDEIHERSADADFLSLVARLLLHRFPDVRLVIMSATLQADLFRVYFHELQMDGAEVPLVAVGGKCFEVKKVFLDNIKDYCKEGLSVQAQSLVTRLCLKFKEQGMAQKKAQALTDYATQSGPLIIDLLACLATSGCTILVFLPGLQEITNIFDECQQLLQAQDGTADSASSEDEMAPRRTFKMKFKVFAMHSQIPMEDQQHVFQTPETGCCHFVLASNVAESSLTLPNVCAVIDLGMNKQQVYDPRMKMTYLALKWTSKASAHQRSGRAGRTMAGVVLRLYPEEFFEKELPEFDRPETAVLPLPRLYLQAKQLAKDLAAAEPEDGEAPSTACSVLTGLVDPPDLSIIEASRCELAQGWALEAPLEDAEMTSIGRICLSLPFDLSLSRLVWLSIHWGCVVDGVILACSLAVSDPFSTPTLFAFPNVEDLGKRLRKSNRSRRHFDQGMASQPLALWQLFQEFWTSFDYTAKDGRKLWLKHAHNLAADHAIIPRRMTEFVVQVDEVAQRLVPLLKEGSDGHKKLINLLTGLGRRVDGHMGTDFTDDSYVGFRLGTPWFLEEEALEQPQSKADRAKQIKEFKKPMAEATFETEVDVLRGLLAASFSDKLLTTQRSQKEAKRCAKSFRQMAESSDPRCSIVVKLPLETLKDFPGGPEKLVKLMLDTDRSVRQVGVLGEDEICVELGPIPSTFRHWSPVPSSAEQARQGLLPHDLEPDLHVLNQLTRGKTGVCQVDVNNVDRPRGAAPRESKIVQIQVTRPTHPCQLTWEVHASAEDDQKGRNSTVRRGIPDAHSPIGFICHVPKVEVKKDQTLEPRPAAAGDSVLEKAMPELDQPWYGCCCHVTYTSGNICFLSGLTVLHPKHLKFLLLTVDPQQTNLALLLNDGFGLQGMRIHRKEIPMEVSQEEMKVVDEFREKLRDSMKDGSSFCEISVIQKLRNFCVSGKDEATKTVTVNGKTGQKQGSKLRAGGHWIRPPGTGPMEPLIPERKDRDVEVLQSTLRILLQDQRKTQSKAIWKQLRRELLWRGKTEDAMEATLKKHAELFQREGMQWKLVP